MYGLKQAAILAYQQLALRLKAADYVPIVGSTGMWKHKSRQTIFCLCVDDSGIKYFNKADADHLLHTLGQHYAYTVDWTGRNFCGLTFDWNYTEEYVDVSMPGYVRDALKRLQHVPGKLPQHSPHEYLPVHYGKHDATQYTSTLDTSTHLSPKETKHVQSVMGTFL
jgi:hypothetical protein